MGNDKNKILILSLGMGNARDENNGKNIQGKDDTADNAFEKLLNDQYKYRLGAYCFNIKDEPEKSPFVGEVLLKAFRPKQLVIIGTIRSMWDAFYFKFSDTINEEDRRISFTKLWEIVNRNMGHETDKIRLSEAEREIGNELNKLKEILKLKKIKVILVEYGPGEKAELNYNKITQLKDVFSGNCVNEVAFDITHSFRSIPLYNLTVLNYLKALGEYEIEINKVYYGNLDISNELKKAPIEDLSYLTDVIDLTDAVTSFRMTGNVGVLIDKMKKIHADEKILDTLWEYEWAAETNNFKCMIAALEKIYGIEECASGMVSDAWKMIVRILKKHFPESLIKEAASIEGKARMQYELANWYYEQKKYGLFLATAQEAIRSYLLPLYCRKKEKEIVDEESCRRDAMEYLKSQGKKLKKVNGTESEAAKFVIHMAAQQQEIIPIRNIFAHCLEDEDHSSQYNKSDLDKIEEYHKTLGNFYEYMVEGEKRQQFVELFNKEQAKTPTENNGKYLRLIVGANAKEFQERNIERFRVSSKKQYDVRQLEADALRRINEESATGKKRRERVSAVLEMIKKEKANGRKKIAIILYEMKNINDIVAVCMEFAVQGLDSDVTVYIYEETKGEQSEASSSFKQVNIPRMGEQ